MTSQAKSSTSILIATLIPILIPVLVPIAVAIIVALIPTPEGLNAQAQYFFAVFLAVVLGLILEPLPPALIGLVGVTFCAAFGLVGESGKEAQTWALSGFSNGVIWLIFAAFMFALGVCFRCLP